MTPALGAGYSEFYVCDYVILGIPNGATEGLSSRLPRKYRLEFWQVAAARNTIPSTHTVALLVSGFCSCGIYSGPSPVGEEDRESKRGARRVQRYRKLGWSESKIHRALEDSNQAHAKSPVAVTDADIRDIEALLSSVAAQDKAGLYILVHTYNGHLADEKFLVTQKSLPATELRLSAPKLLPDVLTCFRHQPRRPLPRPRT